MELGPFEPSEAEQIEVILEKHGVAYEIEIDEELKQSRLDDFNGKVNNNPTASIGSLDLRYIYFIISDEDCGKVAIELKPMESNAKSKCKFLPSSNESLDYERLNVVNPF